MSQLEVQIMGQSYLLSCPAGGEAAMTVAVQRVDDAMCRIRDVGKIKARDRIAVLAALNLAAANVGSNASANPSPSTTPSLSATEANSGTSSREPGGTVHQGAAHSSHLIKIAAGDEVTNLRLTLLRARLDAVLGADGQLI